MLFDTISKDDTNQLRDPGQKQVCVKCFVVLGPASGKSKAVFKVIDRTFYRCPDFVSTVPFIRSAQCAGICPQVFFGIDINHPSARRESAGI